MVHWECNNAVSALRFQGLTGQGRSRGSFGKVKGIFLAWESSQDSEASERKGTLKGMALAKLRMCEAYITVCYRYRSWASGRVLIKGGVDGVAWLKPPRAKRAGTVGRQ